MKIPTLLALTLVPLHAEIQLLDPARRWFAVNDNVMGGVSEGGPQWTESDTLLFSGNLSLENRGGFSSTRSNSDRYALPGDGTLVLKVRGLPRGYYMDLRTNTRQGGFSYRSGFSPASEEEWEEIRLPLSSFRASAFGMNLPVAPVLNPTDIVSIGFTAYDRRSGPFRLEVAEIRYEPVPEIPPEMNADPVQAVFALAIQRGVPLFNRGNPDACAAVYEVAVEAVLRMEDDLLSASESERLNAALREMRESETPADAAWALRRGMDQVIAGRSDNIAQE